MSDNVRVLRYEVNYLTEALASGIDRIRSIEQEFDFIQMCQGMSKPFGIEARELLDRFIALSLRKLASFVKHFFLILIFSEMFADDEF